MGLNVLITNSSLGARGGTPLYVRDLALELLRQGHRPAAYSPQCGEVAEELRAAGIPVERRLRALRFAPDVIHGHHRAETYTALLRYPNVPALFICHDHTYWRDIPPPHPRVLRHFGVSRVCLEFLNQSGIPPERASLLPNFVDTRRFLPRGPLPPRPVRALVFSNYASGGTHLPAVQEACRRAGLELDVVGSGVGRCVARPEEILGQYDLVFAKARAAMEAMAVGAAVVLCDFAGVGPLVATDDFDRLRPMNFGFEAMDQPHDPEVLLREIARYDPEDARRVRDRIREEASLEGTTYCLVALYEEMLQEGAARGSCPPDSLHHHLSALRDNLASRLADLRYGFPPSTRRFLERLPGIALLHRRARRSLMGAAEPGRHGGRKGV